MTQTLQNLTLFNGINGVSSAAVDISPHSPSYEAPGVIHPAPTKPKDKPLLYDVQKHGKVEIGETLYLYADGTFEKVGEKHGK